MKRIIWLISIIFVLALSACQGGLGHEFKGSPIDPPLPIPDFSLTTAQGDTFQFAEAQGDILLFYFGYTYCPDVCPLTMWEVSQAVQALGEDQDRVQVVFVSVDPARDTPEVLETYLANFGSNVIGLRDDMEKVEAVMKPFGAYGQAEKAEADGSYLVSHSARLYLVKPEEGVLLTYPFGFKAAELQEDLAYLLKST
jgi:protein SCO1/2